MRAALLLTLVLVAVGCSAPQTPPATTPSPTSVRGLPLTLAAVKDAVQFDVPLAIASIADPETEADAEAMAETLFEIAAGSPEFTEALLAATVDDLAADLAAGGATHTWRYAEDAVDDDSGYSLVVLLGFRLAADGTAYLRNVRAAG